MPPQPSTQVVPIPHRPRNNTTTHASTSATNKEQGLQDLTFVPINDGTQRVTIKWKPPNFDELLTDEAQWNLAATDTIHWMMQTATDATIYSWTNEPTTMIPPLPELTPDNLRSYMAPKASPITSIKMYIFSLRICFTSGSGK